MTTAARVVAWLRGLRRCGELLRQIAPGKGGQPSTRGGAPPSRSSAAREAGLSVDQRKTALKWIDVPVRELTREEIQANPARPRIVKLRWLDRERRDQP